MAVQRNEAHAHVQLARRLAASGDLAGARNAADLALSLDPTEPELLDGIGAVYSACDEQSLALPLFQRAVELAPCNAHFLFNLAAALRFAGRFEEAESAADTAIAVNPRDPGLWRLRSELRTQTAGRNHVAALEAMLRDADFPPAGRVQLHYALAKEYEDIGEYARSFATLAEGAGLRRRHMSYDVTADVRTIARIIETHDAEAFSRLAPGNTTREPIFVLGLPRTGTTLVERILGSHSAVTAAGELRDFPAAMIQLAGELPGGSGLGRDGLVAHALLIDMHELGSRYLARTRPKTGSRAHFVDKLPLNFLYCGLIHAALPNARIVHLRRHPMDACYAIYKTLFTRAYPFSYDLTDLGRYYAAYHRLMEHWRATFPRAIYDLEYESLVADPRSETRRLLAHCRLELEAACLDVHRNPAASTTASAVQVRQPIHRESVGRWRNVAAQLEPLSRILRAEGLELK